MPEKRNALAHEVQYEQGNPLPSTPGAVWFQTYRGNPRGWMHFACPCGCGKIGAISFDKWNLVSDMPRINVTPSIDFDSGHWHGFLTDGEFREC